MKQTKFMLENNKSFIIFVLFAFSIRTLLCLFPGFKFDVDSWFLWSIRLNEVGLSNFYNPQFFSDYLPGYMYVLHFLGLLRNLLQLDNNSFYFLLKMPGVLAEIIIGILVYKEVNKNFSKNYATLAASFILLNPALIFNSSIWGQIDSVLALGLIIAIYFLKNKFLVLSSFMLSVAFLIKPQSIAIFPIFVLFFLKNFSIKNLAKLFIPFVVTISLASLPFFSGNPIIGLINLFLKTTSQYAYTSLFAYNFWGVVGFWINDAQLWNGLSYQIIGVVLLSVYWLTLSYFYLNGKLPLYTLTMLALLGFYFLPTRVHERYLYPGLVFFILTASLYKSRLLLLLASLLSCLHFLNLYYVYVYYNEFYLKLPKLLYFPLIYTFLDSNGKILSIISTIIFILTCGVIIKYSNAKKDYL